MMMIKRRLKLMLKILALPVCAALSSFAVSVPVMAGMVAVNTDDAAAVVQVGKSKIKHVAALTGGKVRYSGHYAHVRTKGGDVDVYAFAGVSVHVRHGGNVFVSVGY